MDQRPIVVRWRLRGEKPAEGFGLVTREQTLQSFLQ
jgi:hypothetical protein